MNITKEECEHEWEKSFDEYLFCPKCKNISEPHRTQENTIMIDGERYTAKQLANAFYRTKWDDGIPQKEILADFRYSLKKTK